jgi:hypothetical protein
MRSPIRLRALVVVRAAIARHIDVPISFVLERHLLEGDLGLDRFDLSLIGVALAEEVGREVELSIEPSRLSTVGDLAAIASAAMFALLGPELHSASDVR